MLRCVIIDDDEKNRKVLRELLKESRLPVVVEAEAENARDGVHVIRRSKPNLVFLDIEMPYGNAFDLLDELGRVDFEIIFITAFSEYSLRAFRYSALDYLLKPVDAKELKEAVEKAISKVDRLSVNDQVQNLLYNFRKNKIQQHRIALPSKEGYDFVEVGEIVHCQARDTITFIFLLSGEKYISSRSLGEYEKLLPEDIFFRVHNSSIINMNHVRKFHKLGRSGHVELLNGVKVEVSYRKKEKFLARFGLH